MKDKAKYLRSLGYYVTSEATREYTNTTEIVFYF